MKSVIIKHLFKISCNKMALHFLLLHHQTNSNNDNNNNNKEKYLLLLLLHLFKHLERKLHLHLHLQVVIMLHLHLLLQEDQTTIKALLPHLLQLDILAHLYLIVEGLYLLPLHLWAVDLRLILLSPQWAVFLLLHRLLPNPQWVVFLRPHLLQ
jgi:hypothetical protein